MSKNTAMQTRPIKLQFRWPIEQIHETAAIMHIPIGATGLIQFQPGVQEALKLSEPAAVATLQQAEEVIIRNIAIV